MFLMYNLYHHLIFTHKKLTMATINNLLALKQPASLQPNAIDAFDINIDATNAEGSKFRRFLVEQEEKVDEADEEARPKLRGQTIDHLFSVTELAGAPIVELAFDNADDIVGTQAVVNATGVRESRKNKVSFLASNSYMPSDSFFAVMMLWGRKKKRHFFRDSIFAAVVFSKELNLSLTLYLNLRGWLLKVKGDGSVDVSYRRISQCLQRYDQHTIARYYHLSAIMDRMYQHLHSSTVFQLAPHESDIVVASLLGTANKKADDDSNKVADDDSNKDANDSEDIIQDESENESDDERNNESNNESNNVDVDDKEDKDRDKFIRRLPTHGKSSLIDFHQPASASGRQRREHQTLKLALTSVKTVFIPVLNKKQLNHRQLTHFFEKFFCLVFHDCDSRRSVLEGVQDIFMSYRDLDTILEQKTELRAFLQRPSEFLTHVRDKNSLLLYSDYRSHLFATLRNKFKKSSLDPDARSLEREHIISRFVAYVLLEDLNKRSNTVTNSAKRLVGSRKIDSLIQQSTAKPPEDAQQSKRQKKSFNFEIFPSLLRSPPPVRSPDWPFEESSDEEDQKNPPPSASPVPASGLPFESTSRWKSLRIATLKDVAALSPFLRVMAEHYEVRQFLAPVEVYATVDLHSRLHCFVGCSLDLATTTTKNNPMLTIPATGSIHVIPGVFSVGRTGLNAFDDNFDADFFKIPIAEFADFVFRNGTKRKSGPNSARVLGGGLCSDGLGTRIDFGCAGQHYQKDENGKSRPATLCGTGVFKGSGSLLFRAMLGRIIDRMALTSAHLCPLMDVPIGRNYRRFAQYSSHLREFLFAKHLICEWVTVSLQNLTAGETGKEHRDDSNDQRQGYNRVECFSILFVDGAGDVWNLKVIVSWRCRIGDYLTCAVSQFMRIKNRFAMMIANVNGKFDDVLGQYTGPHHPSRPPTALDPSSFWLDDHMPFVKSQDIGRGLFEDYFLLPTGTNRSYWMSLGLSGVYHMGKRRSSVEDGIQLCMVLAWQNSFLYYNRILQRMEEDEARLQSALDVSRYYWDVCREMFSSVVGVKDGSEFIGGMYPRYNCVGFHFGKVFESNGSIRMVTAELRRLLESVNRLGKTFPEAVPVAAMDNALEAASRAINQQAKCELSRFRLLVFCQACAHLGIVLKSGTWIRNLPYPVEDSASLDHLKRHGFTSENVEEACEFLCDEMNTTTKGAMVMRDNVEVMLCESIEGRLLTKFDVFVRGQSLLMLDEYGSGWVKDFGEYQWKRTQKRFVSWDPRYVINCLST
jgi:hypothetical protein